MPKKTAGKVPQPPGKAEFDKLDLAGMCREVEGVHYRLHSTDPDTGKPWEPIYFSNGNNTRFDPKHGVGTLCVAKTLPGAMMEIFDDHWGAVGSIGRSVTETHLNQMWVSLVSLPKVRLVDLTGASLSKLGGDAQILTGLYSTTRKWALQIMRHPANVDGILYRSRHDPSLVNVALFKRAHLLPAGSDSALVEGAAWTRGTAHPGKIVYGPPALLSGHPKLDDTLIQLEVARIQ